jgi:hypothetical protein
MMKRKLSRSTIVTFGTIFLAILSAGALLGSLATSLLLTSLRCGVACRADYCTYSLGSMMKRNRALLPGRTH